MANWTILKEAITSVIKTNGNQEITGQLLQNVLNSMVSSVGENATFAGIATPATSPGTPDGPVFYIASQAGTYSNFGGIEIDSAGIFTWDGTSWSFEKLDFIISDLIVDNLTTGGHDKVLSAEQGKVLKGLVDNIDIPIVNDLTTGGEGSALSAEMGKVLGSMLGRVVNINDNKTYRLWVGTQDDFDELDGAYDDDVIYFVGTKQTATVITAITHGTQSGNTMQFTAVLDPVDSSVHVTWSVVTTPAGSATINSSGLLTISADCSVVVTAVCGKSTMSSDNVSLQYAPDPSENIVFEDANVKAALLAAMGKSGGGEITYGEASKWSTTATKQASIFTNYKTGDNAITKFNEWKYFPHIINTTCVKDATSLVEVQFPPLDLLNSYGAQINNIGATELVVPCTEVGANAVASCSSLVSLKFTSRLATLSNGAQGAVSSCSALRTVDMSECTFTTETNSRLVMDCTNLYIVKLPSSLQTMAGQILRGCPNVKYLVIGDAVNGSDLTSFSPSLYNGPGNLEIVLYAPYVAGHITAFATDSKAFAKLYVPDDDVDAYKADSVFSTYASKIYGISELPSGWETPPALT